jgi:hypothetical protein
MTTDHFCFYLQNRLIQTGQTGGQQYSDTSPSSIPWHRYLREVDCSRHISSQKIHFNKSASSGRKQGQWVKTNQSNFRIYPMDIRLSPPHGTILTACADVCTEVGRC